MKVEFLGDPVTRLIIKPPDEAGGKRHQLVEQWRFSVNDVDFIVPSGFWTDWASIPKVFRAILDRDGPWARAALAHDFLYFATYGTREFCDLVLLYGMETDGVGWLARRVIYRAVRLGGWATWEEYARNKYRAIASFSGEAKSVSIAGWDRKIESA